MLNRLSWIWSGVGILGFLGLWFWGSFQAGSLVLPSPWLTSKALIAIVVEGEALRALMITTGRVLGSFGLSMALGLGLGLVAGMFAQIRYALSPLITLMLAIPPVAWVVVILLWFGMGTQTVGITLTVALIPIPFLATVEGVRSVSPRLKEMATLFRLTPLQYLHEIVIPHLLTYLFPATLTAFATAWKVAVMAELLGAREGIGAQLAISRSNLDTAQSLAWIILGIIVFLGLEYSVLRPLRERLEPWRFPRVNHRKRL